LSVVFDASALLAVVLEEVGAGIVLAEARNSIVSAVNLDEVFHKGVLRGVPIEEVEEQVARLEIEVRSFDVPQARVASELHPRVHRLDISFADRACLALGLITGRTILTADRAWTRLDLGIDIRLIR
jgi:ribonuclease VapC